MGVNILTDLLILRDYVTRDIEVEVVGRDISKGYKLRVVRNVLVCFPGIHDEFQILLAETVLGTILLVTFLGINHKDALGASGMLLIDDDNASRDTGSVEEV